MPSLRSRISVRWMMPPLLVLPVVLVAVILIAHSYYTSMRDASELVHDTMEQIHHRIEEHLNRLMDLPPAMTQMARYMLDADLVSFDEVAHNRMPFYELLRTFPDVSSVVIGSAQGRAFWVIRYPGETAYELAIKTQPDALMQEYDMGSDGAVLGDARSAFAFDPTGRPWYRAAIAADGPTWGDIYIWVRDGEGETLGIPWVEPVRDAQQQILGVLNTELTLQDISDFLARLRVGRSGRAFIMEHDGNLVATSVDLATMTVDFERVRAADVTDPRIAEVAAYLPQAFGPLAAIDAPRYLTMTVHGRAMRVVVSPYENRSNLRWLIVTVVPEDDFLAASRTARNRGIVVAVAAAGAMVLLSLLLVALMLRPILHLVAHVRRVGGGDLDATLTLDDNREMAELSRELNEMVHGLKDRLQLRHSMNLAMDVQQALLPSETPKVPGIDIAARAQYCDETGGDYYDYLEAAGMDDHTMVVALGDVMGHGVAAAMLMATARGMLRSRMRVVGSLGEMLTHVNDLLVVDTGGTRFMTMFIGLLDTQARALRWASAGHDAPLIYDPSTDAFLELGDHGGLPLGVMAGETYEEAVVGELKAGQVLVVGTDGLWESRNEQGEQFGQQRLREAIRELAVKSADEIEQALYHRLLAFCGTETIADDITYVVLKFTWDATSPDWVV